MQNVKVVFAYKQGFRRLWLALSVIWIVGYGGLLVDFGKRLPNIDGLMTTFLPVVLLYAFGATIVWIVEGFAKADR